MAGTIEIAESPVTHDSKIEYAYWTQAAADCVLLRWRCDYCANFWLCAFHADIRVFVSFYDLWIRNPVQIHPSPCTAI